MSAGSRGRLKIRLRSNGLPPAPCKKKVFPGPWLLRRNCCRKELLVHARTIEGHRGIRFWPVAFPWLARKNEPRTPRRTSGQVTLARFCRRQGGEKAKRHQRTGKLYGPNAAIGGEGNAIELIRNRPWLAPYFPTIRTENEPGTILPP